MLGLHRPGDQAGDHGALTDAVGVAERAGEDHVDSALDLAVELRMGGVDAGSDDRDQDAGAPASRPRSSSAASLRWAGGSSTMSGPPPWHSVSGSTGRVPGGGTGAAPPAGDGRGGSRPANGQGRAGTRPTSAAAAATRAQPPTLDILAQTGPTLPSARSAGRRPAGVAASTWPGGGPRRRGLPTARRRAGALAVACHPTGLAGAVRRLPPPAAARERRTALRPSTGRPDAGRRRPQDEHRDPDQEQDGDPDRDHHAERVVRAPRADPDEARRSRRRQRNAPAGPAGPAGSSGRAGSARSRTDRFRWPAARSPGARSPAGRWTAVRSAAATSGEPSGFSATSGTSAVSAATGSTRPKPNSSSCPGAPMSRPVAIIRFTTFAASRSGNCARTRATTPLVIAVADDVPPPVWQ